MKKKKSWWFWTELLHGSLCGLVLSSTQKTVKISQNREIFSLKNAFLIFFRFISKKVFIGYGQQMDTHEIPQKI